MKRLFDLLPLLALLCPMVSLTAQNGLQAEYYDGTNFNRKVVTRIDDKIDLYWNNIPPVKGIDPHECSIRWTGRLMAPKSGTYIFSARVDDGIRVWVGGQKVIDDWGLNDVGIFSGQVQMEAGKFYDLKVEYFNALIEGEITLLWEIPGEEEKSWFSSWFAEAKPQVIDAEFFYQPPQPEPIVIEKPAEKKPERAVVAEAVPGPTPKSTTKPPSPKKTPMRPNPEKEVATVETIKKYIPENIHFEQAKTDILPESYSDLDELADFLIRQTHLKVTVEGHTDYVGDAYKNVLLSQDRADAVSAYLIGKGVEENRISTKGYGGSKPLAKNDGRKYHPENRRVVFVVE